MTDQSLSLGFKNIQVVDFQNVDVSGKVIEQLMSNCPSFQRLRVFHSIILDDLTVSAKTSVVLKYLEIRECCQIRKVEVVAKNLLTLHSHGKEMPDSRFLGMFLNSFSYKITGTNLNLAYILTLFLKCFAVVSLTYKFSNLKTMPRLVY